MFILRPSSPLRQAAARPDTQLSAAPASDAGGGSDLGEPLPENYEVDIVRAVLQDPFRIFIYWEVRQRSLDALTRYFSPDEVESFRVVLRLFEVEGRNEAFFEVARRGRYWMTVFPDREYEFEIGVRSPAHGYISLVRSNRVRTPRGTVSPEPAKEEDYRLSPNGFVDVLNASGFGASQPINFSVVERGEHVRSFPHGVAALPEPVRRAVMFANSGEALTPEMIAGLPEPLRTEMTRLLAAGGGILASVALMHYLPELFRETHESNSDDWIGNRGISPMRVTPRFFFGGSENNFWPGSELTWPLLSRLPSSFSLSFALGRAPHLP